MASLQEKLADSLSVLRLLQDRGFNVIQTNELSRTHRERLVKNGFLQEIMKGWYISVHPREAAGESTAWYTSFWDFCAIYLNKRFGKNWSLSPEQSLLLHVENDTVPKQLLVRTPKARNKVTTLPHGTSILDLRADLPQNEQVDVKNNMRLFSLQSALVSCGPGFFIHYPTDARAALAMIADAADVLTLLLEGGRTTVAGRLAGAFRNIGQKRIADDIVKAMKAVGYDVREKDPFDETITVKLASLHQSPYVNRIRLMWKLMRESVQGQFPLSTHKPVDIEAYLALTDEKYTMDAYHSLSIEGYQVTPELIEHVRSGEWNPDKDEDDREHRNALAARGYWQAYQSVRESIRKVLEGQNPGSVVDSDHGDWFREMFAPSVTAGFRKPADIAGYRIHQVYIRRSMHVPLRYEAVRDCMPIFFDLLKEEADPIVRAVLGHFVFVFIHPYMDGNGRIGRFLMNVMFAAAGYPWTVIPIQKRDPYMNALEQASVQQDIKSFTVFLRDLVNER